jgi:type II secretory pathway pseudopilin PulG
MKLTQNTSIKRNSGMTLIELTVVIVVLLALIAVLFVGAQAYKKGADKAACVMIQRNVQQACRSYYNLKPVVAAGVAVELADIAALTAAGTDLLGSIPVCPKTGVAFALTATVETTPPGTLFAACPSIPLEHVPTAFGSW